MGRSVSPCVSGSGHTGCVQFVKILRVVLFGFVHFSVRVLFFNKKLDFVASCQESYAYFFLFWHFDQPFTPSGIR